jgi:hypothetical protein
MSMYVARCGTGPWVRVAWFLESTIVNGFHVFRGHAGAGIALKVKFERDNVVKPVGGQVENVSGL